MVGVVKVPEKVFKKLNKSILPQWKVSFIAALVVGLLAHFYKITNWLPNWDSLVFRYDPQNMIAIGRWFLPVACSFSSFYDLPFLNGLLAIIFHALGAVCICKILGVQKKVTALLIGAVVVSFPTVTSVMMYNYVADGYGIAFLLATLSALYMTKEKPNYIISAVLLAFSTGIYQAYVTVTIMLVLFKLIDSAIYGNIKTPQLLKKTLFILLSGAAGMALYYGVLNIILSVTSTTLLDYQGVNAAASLSGIDIAGSLYVIKETFINCFFDTSKGISLYVVLNAVVFLVAVAYYLGYVIKNKVYKEPLKLITLPLFCGMLIIGASVLALINAEVDYHSLMRMGYSVFYLFFIVIYERGNEKEEKHTAIKRWAVLVLAATLVANQIVIANVSYHKAQMSYEKSYGVLVRIADRIEQTENADGCEKVAVTGHLKNSEDYSATLPPEITGITDGYIIRADDEMVGQSVFCSAINDYCGKDYKFLAGEEKRAIQKSEQVQSMGEWPSKDCVAVIDNTIVVKLGEEDENK